MKDSRNNKLLRIYIFAAVYSNALRIVLGKWGTLLADAILLMILLYTIFFQSRGKLRFRKKYKILFSAIIFLQFCAIFEILNENIENTLYGLIEYRKSIFQMLCFFLAYYCADKNQFWDNLSFTELIIAPTIVYGIKQSFFYSSMDAIFYGLQDAGRDTLQYGGMRRAISIYSGPFHFGMLCTLTLCIAIALLIRTGKKRHIILIGLCLFGAYCSLTRTNLVCCIAVVCVFILGSLTGKNTTKSLLRKTIIVLLCLLLLGLFIVEFSTLFDNGNMLAVLINSVLNISTDTRFAGRLDTWATAIDMIKQHPFLGYGMGAAGDTLESYGVAAISVTPHNMFIKLFVEIGIIGVVLMVIILFQSFKLCLKTTDRLKKSFYISCFSTVLLNALVGSTISTFPVMSIFWIFIGMQAVE